MNTLSQKLGSLALVSRLKILGERLMQDSSKIYHDQNLDFEARWFLIFYQLMLKSPMTITEIADSCGITQTNINKLAGEMIKAKIIVPTFDKDDKRRRLLSLTAKGKKIIPQIKPVWDEIESCTSELINSVSVDFFSTLKEIENSLDQKNIYSRVSEKLKNKMLENIEILEYKPEYKKYFKMINYQWLKKYFTVEPIDKVILSDPENQIIKKGGHIFFARYGDKIAGTCALIKYNDEQYELAKMGVLEKFQRKQIGKKLVLAVIEKVKNLNGKSIFLETHLNLLPAIKLYRQLGFLPSKSIKENKYERKGFTMRLDLKNEKNQP